MAASTRADQMGSPFKIPKKKHPSESSLVTMTSPLSRLQNNNTAKSKWTPEALYGKRPNVNGCNNGRKDSNTGASSWRPKRASDSVCRRDEDKHPSSSLSQRSMGSGLSGRVRCLEFQGEKDREDKNDTDKCLMNEGGDLGQNGQHTDPSAEKKVLEEQVKTPENRGTSSNQDWTFPRKKLRLKLTYKTYQRIKHSAAEPIVLSSDDEDCADRRCTDGRPGDCSEPSFQKTSASGASEERVLSPSIIQLTFSTLHHGTTRTLADGLITITEECISIPLKGVPNDKGDTSVHASVSVSIVPSELQAFGVWNTDTCESRQQHSSSSSFLFLVLTDAQARLMHTELSSLRNTHTAGLACPFVLVLLAGRLKDLQHASLVSLMGLMALKSGRPQLSDPLSLDDGFKRLQSNPRGFHLLNVLRQKMRSSRMSQNGTPNGLQKHTSTRPASLRSSSLSRRLIQFPPPPSKGGITVTMEDLECLRDGEFLNDVIIDFYLKFLQLESEDRDLANRSHIFSSFFYKQLTRKDNATEEEAGGTVQYRRHQRVRTWTRNVDIFSKDFLFIPVNQEAHWYLVVICFPGLLQTDSVTWNTRRTGSPEEMKSQSKDGKLKPYDLPDCTARNCKSEMIIRRPCILIMDSLKLSNHSRVFTLLREYLQVEWEMRRGTPRLFNEGTIKGSQCRVPLQDNSSDCGLYLLQYVESFLQNPVVHFDLPLRLERWFPRQQVRKKRAELRELVLQLYRKQGGDIVENSSTSS